MASIEETYAKLDGLLRKSSLAEIGGFRPPEDKITSWFGGPGVGKKGEARPQYKGKDMFCLLQVKISELPYIPKELENTAFLTVFFNVEEHPFDQAHGDGWLIREYQSLDDLELLSANGDNEIVRNFPIRWQLAEDDAPSWDDTWDILDLTIVNEDDAASDKFFDEYNHYPGTKFGGYPCCIQHEAGIKGFIFQIGSEEKPDWMWADNGIAHFHKTDAGEWTFSCQFY